MKFKKAIFLAVISALTLSLVACSSEETPTEIPEDTSSSSEIAIEAPGDGPIFGEFSTVDINGQDVDNSIFADHELTMVSVWATTCTYCITEMPVLKELNDKYADQGFQVVGVVMDTIDVTDEAYPVVDSVVELTKEIVDKTGADYTHMIPNKDMLNTRKGEITGTPSAYFVDSEGKILSNSEGIYVSARSKASWVETIDALLLSQLSISEAFEQREPFVFPS